MVVRRVVASAAGALGLALVTAAVAATSVNPAGERAWDGVALESVVVYAQRQRSSALVVSERGRVIAERCWPVEAAAGSAYANMLWARDEAGAPTEDVASLQKSVVSVLVGIAADRGLLDLDAPVSAYLGTGWSKATAAQESAITIRHLLSMTSGLTPTLELSAPAGSVWHYNTGAYSKLVDVVEKAAGADIGRTTRQWLTDPIGMTATAWRRRPWVTPGQDANPIGLYTTARDLARFGELVLAGGVWSERRVVSQSYLEAAFAPSQALNPAYGLLWWLNGWPSRIGPTASGDTALAPAAPRDMVAAQGLLGRKVYVVPSLGLVVVRLGDAPERAFDQRLWELLMAARPRDLPSAPK